MTKLRAHPKNELILASYLPYAVQAQGQKAGFSEQPQGLVLETVTGTLAEISYPKPNYPVRARLEGAQTEFPQVKQVLPVLYALHDLPQLPGRALEQVVRRMDLWQHHQPVVEIQVLASWLNHLTLAVKTSEEKLEVKLSSWGDIWWRAVVATQRADPSQPVPWRALPGQPVLDTYELLRQLHVAVGPVSACQQEYKQGQPYGEATHYVRKAVPQEPQEGGQADG